MITPGTMVPCPWVLMNGQACSWVLMGKHKWSWAFMSVHKCLWALISTPEWSWVLMITLVLDSTIHKKNWLFKWPSCSILAIYCFCWEEISMLNSLRQFFWYEGFIFERIYSAQEYNFIWQEINVLRSWKDFCRPICYSGKNLFSLGRINAVRN